ncbi:alpha/beta-hydrolase [Trematosphaeria pertusa]|uniref:Alpha/beta-hydrolase n=1 Tax=Trematosphaeria pertusa TaxID=390896 RepID=A0A6A6IDE8_9PLEO|nr:alpha/beta-hydrolase [Trematosphaeria pertusa]KAF2248421.1 alpha/beta-hydrolase [Trematosphaeria pertusa]
MALQPINPVEDPRIDHKFHRLRDGITYHYLYGEPQGGRSKATVFLIHGWPDCSAGWRFQIPLLLDMGFRVVAPDLMGFGATDAPDDISLYSLKRASDDIAELAKVVGAEQILLGGHDWGGFVVWRAAQWHPELVTHVFSICTPYSPPHKDYVSTEDLAKGPLPQFAYQLHLASGDVGKSVNDEQSIRQLLKAIYGGKGPNGEYGFDSRKGVLVENLPAIGESKLLNGKILDYYVKEYCRHGIESTLNWYRTRRINYEDDLALLDKKTISIPTLFVQATHDSVLKPEMSKNMDVFLPGLTRAEVVATHWALMQKPAEVNSIIAKWLEGQGFGTKSSL